ncbi:MAG: hypothetical protein AB7R69_04715 [Candidatus Babeliales bacterium]
MKTVKLLYLLPFIALTTQAMETEYPCATEVDFKEFHLVTFCPTQQNPSETFENVVIKLKNNNREKLDGATIATKESGINLSLSTKLPENYRGNIHIGTPGAICCCDEYVYPERSAVAAYSEFNKGQLGTTDCVVSFCLPNHDRRQFNFGQKQDQITISKFLNILVQKNPSASIILHGACSGATSTLNTLACDYLAPEAKASVKKVVLQCPAISSEKVWEDMSANHLPWGLRWIFPIVARLFYPNCKQEKTAAVLDSYKKIPKIINFFIAQLNHDKVTPPASVKLQKKVLEDNGNTVTYFECNNRNIKHAYLTQDQDYLNAVKQFLKEKHE